jgi:glycerol transport system ATP-binding protein
LSKPTYPQDFALKTIELDLQDGRAYALLGPSGCGKSTLLRLISGLLQPTQGQIQFDGKDVTRLSARQRHVAEVFQFPVVYETMSVYDNLAFPLKNRKLNRDTIKTRVAEVADLLGLTDELRNRPASLSAGVRQLVSLGRGLVRTDVNAILFDEPLTVIDPQEKWHLRTRLKQLHRQFELTMIYVTHDQTEALTFADTVMVMHEGRILQSASPSELFERPSHKFVGQFIGSPGMNFIRCQVDGNAAIIEGQPVPLQGAGKADIDSNTCELGFRPEYCVFSRDGSGIAAQLVSVDRTSRRRIAYLTVAGSNICVSMPADHEIPADDHHIRIDPQRALLYSSDVLVADQR